MAQRFRHVSPHRSRRSRGFGLVEILVGVTIGMLALLIVYQVLSLAEGYRRTTTAGGDAQSAGMISSYMLAQEIGNGGHTIADAGRELADCANTGNFATSWRPVPVLITDGGADNVSDSFAIIAGTNRRLVTPLDITATYNPGNDITVQSPLGFHGSHSTEASHLFVLIDRMAGNCEAATIANWGGPTDPLRQRTPGWNAATGIVTITPTPAPVNTYPQGQSWLVNLGPSDRVRKMRYDIAGDVLRSTDLLNPAAVPNPIVSNVVLMKAQYGIDTNNDTFVDTWVSAQGAWTDANVLAAPLNGPALPTLRSIKAIRIALVVRSSQFERVRDAEGRAAVGTEASSSADLASNFQTTLFNCYGVAAPACTGEITNIVIPNTANYRYRVFEQVIPLTNQIWNAS